MPTDLSTWAATGYLGKDPESHETGDTSYTTVSLAVARSYKDKNGEWQTITDWADLKWWGTRGQGIQRAFQSGDRVSVGNARHRHTVVGEGDARRHFYSFENGDIQLISRKQESTESEETEL